MVREGNDSSGDGGGPGGRGEKWLIQDIFWKQRHLGFGMRGERKRGIKKDYLSFGLSKLEKW